MAVWPFGDGEWAPYAIGVEEGIVWATKRGYVGLCGYALIPAEGHPWSKEFPNGIQDSDKDAEDSMDRLRQFHELTEQGLSFEEASERVFGDDPPIDRDYIDRYLDAHGGITYYQHPWVGFDTSHAWDVWPPEWDERGMSRIFRDINGPDVTHWNPDMVAEEAKKLARQVAEIGRLEKDLEIDDEAVGRRPSSST